MILRFIQNIQLEDYFSLFLFISRSRSISFTCYLPSGGYAVMIVSYLADRFQMFYRSLLLLCVYCNIYRVYGCVSSATSIVTIQFCRLSFVYIFDAPFFNS